MSSIYDSIVYPMKISCSIFNVLGITCCGGVRAHTLGEMLKY
jgi:hypothetical protein